ncbi:Alpha/Beta hydrolase protein [Umbelopsis sp. AD052]|nr:Alpha/Beta hydrolase protein [Umbelopsis sp. AD052]
MRKNQNPVTAGACSFTMSSLQKDIFKPKLPPLEALQEDPDATSKEVNNKKSSQPVFAFPLTRRQQPNYSPLSWEQYFETMQDVKVDDKIFRCYQIAGKSKDGKVPPLFVLHHGAGHSALSYGLTAKRIQAIANQECSILAFDCRGHGYTQTPNDTDLSLSTLSNDMCEVIQALYGDTKPDVIVVGHSMGGSVVVDVANRRIVPNLLGVVVLDVVEGSAMEALSTMTSFLNDRPKEFPSVEHAIRWAVSSGTVHNLESARLSFPPLVRKKDEEDANSPYVWHTNLAATQQFWQGWFQDLSDKFLKARAAKFLVLAGTDRLDKTLMIGSMQGKFQMEIFVESGHAIHEDQPNRLAQCLVEFWKRNKRLILPPKVPLKPYQH